MVVKEYFEDDTVAASRRMDQVRFQTKRNLVDRIDDLDALQVGVIAVRLIPNNFMRNVGTEEEGAHQWQKYGFYFPLNQPHDEAEAMAETSIPLAFRKNAIEVIRKEVHGNPENFLGIGFSYHGISRSDRKTRKVGLVKVGKAHRIISYARSIDKPIVEHIYVNEKSQNAGATFICQVPSHRKGIADYSVQVDGVPYFNGTEKRALAWGVGTAFTGHAPKNGLGNIQLSKDKSHYVSPQELASYMAIIENQLANHNFTPLEMSPFPLFSKDQARFALKLANQVLVQDITTKKLRKPYEAEQSWLLMQRAISQGHDKTLYWDAARDGNMSSYKLTKESLFSLGRHL